MVLKVTYPEQLKNSGATVAGRFTAAKANELRSVINANADDLEALKNDAVTKTEAADEKTGTILFTGGVF